MRVNIGNPGSGQRGTMDVVMEALGWTLDDFASPPNCRRPNRPRRCATTTSTRDLHRGPPSGAIQEATTACDAVLVNVTGDAIDALIEETPTTVSPRSPAACIAAATKT